MKKTKKLQLAALLLGVSAAVAGFAVANDSLQVQADETPSFAMEAGAAVRTKADESGIRWITNVDEAWYNANLPASATDVSFGTLVTAANNLTAGTVNGTGLTVETAEVKDLPCTATADFTDGTFTYYSAITYGKVAEGKQKAAYATELVARSYMKYSTDKGATWEYVYADSNDNQRCIRAVALEAIEDEEEFNTLETDEQTAVKGYVGNKATDPVDMAGADRVCETTAEPISGDYAVAYQGAKKVGTFTEGTLTLNADFGYNQDVVLTLFDAEGNYAKTTECKYITQYIDTADEFAEALKRDEATTVWGYYVLTQNIALTGTWTKTYTTFSGTLDGNGHSITGLTLSKGQLDYDGGLFHELGNATIKDVAVVDVKMGNETSGVFSFYAKQGAVTFDNVYVSISSDTVFGEYYTKAEEATLNTLVLKNQSQKAGLVNRGNDADITVNNCVIYMPETLSQASGFICSYGSPKLTITGTTFIGGNGNVVGIRSGSNSKPKYTNDEGVGYQVIDAVQAYKDLYGTAICGDAYESDNKAQITQAPANGATKANENAWTELAITSFEANHPLKVWGASDLTALDKDNKAENLGKLTATTGDIIVLTEDVEVTRNFNTGTISGVFDGQGHKISGITGGKNKGGLFAFVQGSIKNVAFAGDLKGTSAGLVANTVQYNAYLENVYCEVNFGATITDEGYTQGGIFRFVNNYSTSLSMKDVVVYVQGDAMPAASGAIVGYGSSLGTEAKPTTYPLGVYMDNCSYIAPSAQPMGSRGETTSCFGQLTGADKYFFWDIDENHTTDDGLTYYATMDLLKAGASLTDFQKEWLGIQQSN